MVPILPLAKSKAEFQIRPLNSSIPSVLLIAKWLHWTLLSWSGPHRDGYLFYLIFFLFLSAFLLLTLPSMDLLKDLFSIMLFQIMLFWLRNSFSNKSNELIPMIFAALTRYPTKSSWSCRTMEQWNNLLKAHWQLMNKILQIWALFYKIQCMLWTSSLPWPVYPGLEFNRWK